MVVLCELKLQVGHVHVHICIYKLINAPNPHTAARKYMSTLVCWDALPQKAEAYMSRPPPMKLSPVCVCILSNCQIGEKF